MLPTLVLVSIPDCPGLSWVGQFHLTQTGSKYRVPEIRPCHFGGRSFSPFLVSSVSPHPLCFTLFATHSSCLGPAPVPIGSLFEASQFARTKLALSLRLGPGYELFHPLQQLVPPTARVGRTPSPQLPVIETFAKHWTPLQSLMFLRLTACEGEPCDGL